MNIDNYVRPCSVYRYYSDERSLLYVGMALDPDARWEQHLARSAKWVNDQARREDVWFSTVFEAQFAEYLAIKLEHPQCNKASGTKPIGWGRPQQGYAYSGMELHATAVRQFDPALIPGLLQTEGYMREFYAWLKRKGEATTRGRSNWVLSADAADETATHSTEAPAATGASGTATTNGLGGENHEAQNHRHDSSRWNGDHHSGAPIGVVPN